MEQEETTPNGSKKFFTIALGVLAVFLIVAGTAFFLTKQKNANRTSPQIEAPVHAVIPPHVYTDDEKRLALEDFAKHALASTLSDTEKLRALKSFSTKVSAPLLSEEQKRKALLDFATRITLVP